MARTTIRANGFAASNGFTERIERSSTAIDREDSKPPAFTLIGLLVVVAVIAILARLPLLGTRAKRAGSFCWDFDVGGSKGRHYITP